jgi:hypothetical protein
MARTLTAATRLGRQCRPSGFVRSCEGGLTLDSPCGPSLWCCWGGSGARPVEHGCASTGAPWVPHGNRLATVYRRLQREYRLAEG